MQLCVSLNKDHKEEDDTDLTDEELKMGLHEHLCEVQLHLKCFYDKKSDEGHARYVEYRNLCAK
jgi:hypothetical protein